MTIVSFYCKECKLDQDNQSWKENNSYGEWFASKCKKCGKKLIRYITEKNKDPYHYQSRNAIINRQKFAKDLLQPNDYGFKTYYKQEYEKIQKAKEDFEKKEQTEKKNQDLFYKNSLDKGLAKKILQNEEKIKYGKRSNY